MRVWSGVALGIVLLVTWVIAYLVMKVASLAIHGLLFAAAALVILNVVGRLRARSGPVE
jgi:hypothetical protein